MSIAARTLAELSPGEHGKIQSVVGSSGVRHRLLEMGLTRGTEVKLVRRAPLGDPLELWIRGYHLSVRRSEASGVLLEAP